MQKYTLATANQKHIKEEKIMPHKSASLMGYVGEEIVRIWLEKKYPDYEIVRQVMPVGVDPSGGPYIDFGVMKNDKMHAVYEVKGQDFKATKNSKLNKSIKFIWENFLEKDCLKAFNVQDGLRDIKVAEGFEAYIALLVEPSNGAFGGLLKDKDENIIMFKDIFEELNRDLGYADFEKALKEDIKETLKIFRNPTKA